jgi:hypothetical protein
MLVLDGSPSCGEPANARWLLIRLLCDGIRARHTQEGGGAIKWVITYHMLPPPFWPYCRNFHVLQHSSIGRGNRVVFLSLNDT